MKTIVRSFVIALAVSGAIATSYAKAPSAVTAAKTSAMPMPTCAPGDTTCGIYGGSNLR